MSIELLPKSLRMFQRIKMTTGVILLPEHTHLLHTMSQDLRSIIQNLKPIRLLQLIVAIADHLNKQDQQKLSQVRVLGQVKTAHNQEILHPVTQHLIEVAIRKVQLQVIVHQAEVAAHPAEVVVQGV